MGQRGTGGYHRKQSGWKTTDDCGKGERGPSIRAFLGLRDTVRYPSTFCAYVEGPHRGLGAGQILIEQNSSELAPLSGGSPAQMPQYW